MSDIDPRHLALLRTLVAHEVQFVLVGGVGLQVHGYSGATRDVDITIATDPANHRRVGAALEALGAREYLAGPRGTAYDTRFGRLEIMNRTDGIGDYAAWMRNAQTVHAADGLAIAVGAASDLLASKEAADRPKDHDVLPRIRAELLAASALAPADVRGPVADPELQVPPDPAAVALLGLRPNERRGRALWDHGSQLLDDYRTRWRLGETAEVPAPADEGPQSRDYAALKRQLDRLRRMLERSREGPSVER
jgi:hypothetical protein